MSSVPQSEILEIIARGGAAIEGGARQSALDTAAELRALQLEKAKMAAAGTTTRTDETFVTKGSLSLAVTSCPVGYKKVGATDKRKDGHTVEGAHGPTVTHLKAKDGKFVADGYCIPSALGSDSVSETAAKKPQGRARLYADVLAAVSSLQADIAKAGRLMDTEKVTDLTTTLDLVKTQLKQMPLEDRVVKLATKCSNATLGNDVLYPLSAKGKGVKSFPDADRNRGTKIVDSEGARCYTTKDTLPSEVSRIGIDGEGAKVAVYNHINASQANLTVKKVIDDLLAWAMRTDAPTGTTLKFGDLETVKPKAFAAVRAAADAITAEKAAKTALATSAEAAALALAADPIRSDPKIYALFEKYHHTSKNVTNDIDRAVAVSNLTLALVKDAKAAAAWMVTNGKKARTEAGVGPLGTSDLEKRLVIVLRDSPDTPPFPASLFSEGDAGKPYRANQEFKEGGRAEGKLTVGYGKLISAYQAYVSKECKRLKAEADSDGLTSLLTRGGASCDGSGLPGSKGDLSGGAGNTWMCGCGECDQEDRCNASQAVVDDHSNAADKRTSHQTFLDALCKTECARVS